MRAAERRDAAHEHRLPDDHRLGPGHELHGLGHATVGLVEVLRLHIATRLANATGLELGASAGNLHRAGSVGPSVRFEFSLLSMGSHTYDEESLPPLRCIQPGTT